MAAAHARQELFLQDKVLKKVAKQGPRHDEVRQPASLLNDGSRPVEVVPPVGRNGLLDLSLPVSKAVASRQSASDCTSESRKTKMDTITASLVCVLG